MGAFAKGNSLRVQFLECLHERFISSVCWHFTARPCGGRSTMHLEIRISNYQGCSKEPNLRSGFHHTPQHKAQDEQANGCPLGPRRHHQSRSKFAQNAVVVLLCIISDLLTMQPGPEFTAWRGTNDQFKAKRIQAPSFWHHYSMTWTMVLRPGKCSGI